MTARTPVYAGFVGLAILAAIAGLTFEVTTDIAHFLPEGEPDDDVRLARELQRSELARTMVLLVEGPDRETAIAAGRELEEELVGGSGVFALEFVEGGPPAALGEELWTLYAPRTLSFLGRTVAEARARTSDAGLERAARDLLETAGSQLSALATRAAPSDPWLVLLELYERLAGERGGLTVVDGRFVTADGRAAVLFLGTDRELQDSVHQRRLLAAIDAAFARVNAEHDGALALLQSGANRFAVRAEDAIEADVRRVSIGAAVGLTALFVVLFRSLRIVLMTLPVLATGFLAGLVACLLAFGRVHGLTLAFGAALVGVSIDFAVHFHCHQALTPLGRGARTARATFERLWTGLSVGAATTVIGFVALIVATFPGLRELALFGAVGITAALFAARAFLPGLASEREPTRLARRLAGGLGRALARPRRALALPAVAVAAVALVGLPRTTWNDALTDLGRLDPELLAEDEAVRARVVRFEQGRLIVALGDDDEAALAVNDRVADALRVAEATGELDDWRSVAPLLPSAARQRAVAAVAYDDPTLWPRARRALEEAGFVVDFFEPFRQRLESPPPAPLVWDDLAASAVFSLARPFRVSFGERVGFVSFVAGLADEAALRMRLAAVDGARLIDVRGVFDEAFGVYRRRMTSLLSIGCVGIVLLVLARHRAVRPTIAACLPAFLAAAGALGALGLAGQPLNLLSLVALLMVVSMGVDYGVFLAEVDGEDELAATALAVVVAGLSTLLGFGLLAFSDEPSLRTLGLTSGIGVVLCIVLAPTLRAVLPPRTEPRP